MSFSNAILAKMPAEAQELAAAYQTNGLVIFKPTTTVDTEAVFNSYHFAIPASLSFPKLMVDKKTYQPICNRIFPTNPGQVLTCKEAREVKPYTALFLDKELLNEISLQVCKKNNVHFVNKSSVLSNYGHFLINQFIEEARNRQLGYEFILQSLSLQLAVVLLRELDNNVLYKDSQNSFSEKTNINRAIVFLRECYNSNFTLQEIANIANLSPYHFIKVFKSETGKTPFEYLTDIKIEKSKELLAQKKYSITEVGLLCGFTSASHFSTVFSKKIGVSPLKYRQNFID